MVRFGNWIEDHQLAVQTIKEENDRLLNDLSEARKERELLVNNKEQLIDELKQSLAAAYEAKELLTTEHETMHQRWLRRIRQPNHLRMPRTRRIKNSFQGLGKAFRVRKLSKQVRLLVER
jgi:predicted  nucleic acid-binding Zn-ribbon protein